MHHSLSSRRNFLKTAGMGLGSVALGHLLHQEQATAAAFTRLLTRPEVLA